MKSTLSCALFVFLFAPLFAQANIETVLGNVALNQNPNLAVAPPKTSESEIIISREQYVISYNRFRRGPNWVAWLVEANDLGHVKRANDFTKDPDLESYLSRMKQGTAVDFGDYNGSCFERGHQTPSGDRTDTPQNNSETFMMSNMLPQTPYLNEVIWNHLEQYTRALVQQQGKKVYVIAGSVYDLDFGAIGPQKDIKVPSKNFKILIVLNKDQSPSEIDSKTQVIAAVMPNSLADGSAPTPFANGCQGFNPGGSGSPDDWKPFQSTVKDIERISGMNFGLPN